MKPLAMIACMSPNRVIGRDGKLPWHIPEDLKHFKSQTMGRVLIAGRCTFETLPSVVFKGRKVLVVGGDTTCFCSTPEEAIGYARETHGEEEPIVIGGGQLYAACLPLATRIDLTVLDDEYEGDTYFPVLGENEWVVKSATNGDRLTRYQYVRRN